MIRTFSPLSVIITVQYFAPSIPIAKKRLSRRFWLHFTLPNFLDFLEVNPVLREIKRAFYGIVFKIHLEIIHSISWFERFWKFGILQVFSRAAAWIRGPVFFTAGMAVPLLCFSQRLGGSAGEFGDDVSGTPPLFEGQGRRGRRRSRGRFLFEGSFRKSRRGILPRLAPASGHGACGRCGR